MSAPMLSMWMTPDPIDILTLNHIIPNGSRHSTKCQSTGAFRTVFFFKLFLLFISVWNKEVTV